MYARATHSHTNRLQRYKKKLTYTIVYAIFLHFLLKNLLFHLFLRPKGGYDVSRLSDAHSAQVPAKDASPKRIYHGEP